MIVVFSEDGENFKSAAALAQSLGEEIAGVAKQELKFTNKLYVTDFDEDVVVDIVSKESPTLVIGGDTKRDKTVAARVAARLRAAYAPSVVDLKSQGDRFVVKRIGYSGVALATLTLSKPAVITVGKGDSSPKEMQTQVIRQEGKGRVRVVERREGKGTVDLGSAKIIVSVGRGMGSKENVKYAQELADAIGAALAGSRPVTAEMGWLPEDRQVGLSGTKVKPKLYLALGISGQPQHLAGMKDSGLVVAVNKDKNAPIAENCDYLVVADTVEFCQEMVKRLKG